MLRDQRALRPDGRAGICQITKTPIQHVIIIIIIIVGENHTFDNLFGTYQPTPGQTIHNLLSRGIVNADGTPGPHFDRAQQFIGRNEVRDNAETFSTQPHATLPQPYTTSGIGRPFEALAGHPADSTSDLYEKFLPTLIAHVQSDPALWASTAIFITTDEGGGYYDSGYIQPLDFFGDGTRIPFIAVLPDAKKGHVDHTYYDHVSLAKFIEKNWDLPKISSRSRDNLPNPRTDDGNAYVPENGPAIGDLMNLFTFDHDKDDHDRD